MCGPLFTITPGTGCKGSTCTGESQKRTIDDLPRWAQSNNQFRSQAMDIGLWHVANLYQKQKRTQGVCWYWGLYLLLQRTILTATLIFCTYQQAATSQGARFLGQKHAFPSGMGAASADERVVPIMDTCCLFSSFAIVSSDWWYYEPMVL